MKKYESLFTLNREQLRETAFASFFPPAGTKDFDIPFRWIAEKTYDGISSWTFEQQVFRDKYRYTDFPKLRNYLNYTFMRLQVLEEEEGGYFIQSSDGRYICFNSGLQDKYETDLILAFAKFTPRTEDEQHCDWVYIGVYTPQSPTYIEKFGSAVPKLAWYTKDSRDYIFDLSYTLNTELFDHVFERAKERAGMGQVTDEVVKNYLHGVLVNLIPKIKRNYKVAIPMYYVAEKKMQLLLPFPAASGDKYSAFLVERSDETQSYILKTILDMDHAYFAARLITRPDEFWLKP